MPALFLCPKLLQRNTAKAGKNAAYFSFKWKKKQKDYCVSSDTKKFRVEISGKMAYNLEML